MSSRRTPCFKARHALIPLLSISFCLAPGWLLAADDDKPADAKDAGGTEKKLEDLPLRLTAVADEAKHRWDPLNNGALVKGTGCFNGAMWIANGDEEFEVEEVWEDTENATYRMKGTLSGMKVERRITIDRKLGAARYLDIYHNTGDEDLSMVFSYNVGMAFEAKGLYSSRGRQLTAKLGARDFGLAIESPEGSGHPGVLMVVAHERSENKPKVIVAKDNKSLVLDHSIKVKAGQKAALVHWIMQKEFQGAENMEEHFEPLYANRKLVAPAVTEPHLEMVLNFPASYEDMAGGADYLVAVNQLSDRLQLERESETDKMRVENGSVLTGKALGGDLVVSSRFGEIKVPVAKVAILQGASGRGREHKTYLRNGTVLSGPVKVEGLGLEGGFEVSLEMEQLDYLFYRVADGDGEFPEGTQIFVQLHTGEVLPIVGTDDLELGVVSPWGRVGVPAAEIQWMRYVKEPSPRYRIALNDGSLLTVFLDPGEMKLTAGGIGDVTFGSAEIAAMWGAEVELPKGFETEVGVGEIEEIPKEMGASACLLSGSNLIAGELGNEEFKVLTGSTVTAVKVADVVRMSRNGDGTELSPVFKIELGGGDELTGMLQDRVLDVRSGTRLWRVPVQHFIAMRSSGAPPEEPEAEEKEKEKKKQAANSGTRVPSRRVVLPPKSRP